MNNRESGDFALYIGLSVGVSTWIIKQREVSHMNPILVGLGLALVGLGLLHKPKVSESDNNGQKLTKKGESTTVVKSETKKAENGQENLDRDDNQLAGTDSVQDDSGAATGEAETDS